MPSQSSASQLGRHLLKSVPWAREDVLAQRKAHRVPPGWQRHGKRKLSSTTTSVTAATSVSAAPSSPIGIYVQFMFLARPKSLVGPNDHKLLHAHGCNTNEVARVRGEVFYFRHRRSRAAEKPSKKTGARNPPFFGLRAAPGGQKALPSEALSPGALGSPHLFLLGVGGGRGCRPHFLEGLPGTWGRPGRKNAPSQKTLARLPSSTPTQMLQTSP